MSSDIKTPPFPDLNSINQCSGKTSRTLMIPIKPQSPLDLYIFLDLADQPVIPVPWSHTFVACLKSCKDIFKSQKEWHHHNDGGGTQEEWIIRTMVIHTIQWLPLQMLYSLFLLTEHLTLCTCCWETWKSFSPRLPGNKEKGIKKYTQTISMN